jgi:hypothetical protein
VAHGRLSNQLDRLRGALPAREYLPSRNVLRELLGSLREKIEDDLSEHLVLLEELVDVKTLGVTERAELHCLGDDRSLGVNIPLRTREISRDALDQERNVVQEVFGWENPVRRNRDPLADAIEPLRDEDLLRRAQALGESGGQLHWIRI